MNGQRQLFAILSGQEPEYERQQRRNRLRHLIAEFGVDEYHPGLECACKDPAGHLADEILEKWRNWI